MRGTGAVPSPTRAQSHRVSAELGAGNGVHRQPQTQPGDEPGPGPTQVEQQETELQHGPRVHPEDGARDRAGDRPNYSIARARSGSPGLSYLELLGHGQGLCVGVPGEASPCH